jgi:transposase
MLRETSVAEQRYRAVLEAGAGVPVTEVAERFGVSLQSVHGWLRRYQQEGIAGLEARSHRVRQHPWRIFARMEEAMCELRRAHPRWGPRRLVFEMDRRGYGTVTRSTVYRTVNASGVIGLADHQVSVGYQLAGQRVTLRMEVPLMAVIGSGGTLLRTMACPVPASASTGCAPPAAPGLCRLRLAGR